MSEKALKIVKIVAILAAVVLASVLFNYINGGNSLFNLGTNQSAESENVPSTNGNNEAYSKSSQVKSSADEGKSVDFTVKTQTFGPDEEVEFIWDEDQSSEKKSTGSVSKANQDDDIPDNWVLAEDQSIDGSGSKLAANHKYSASEQVQAKKNLLLGKPV